MRTRPARLPRLETVADVLDDLYTVSCPPIWTMRRLAAERPSCDLTSTMPNHHPNGISNEGR